MDGAVPYFGIFDKYSKRFTFVDGFYHFWHKECFKLAQKNEMGESETNCEIPLKNVGSGRCMSIQAMQALFELKENNQLCDATLILDDGTEVPVHRAILCACSSYFRALFTTSLQNREKHRVHLSGITSDMLHKLLVYIYLRKLDINEDNVYSVLITADYLSILGVLDLCCQFLEEHLTPKNCLGTLSFAQSHFCRDLSNNSWKYIMKNFAQIAVESDEILSLSLNQIQDIINSDDLNVKSEETVWEVILRWIDHDTENRRKHIVELMKCIRLGLLDTQFFLEHVKEHPYVSSSEESRPMIIETLKFLYDLEMITHSPNNIRSGSQFLIIWSPRDGEVITPEIARPRVPHEILFAIGGWSGGSPTNFIETYDTRADRWVKVEEVDPAGSRAYHGTAVVGFKIYVIGGFDGMDYFNSCRCFDAVTKTWKEVAPMHSRRCYVSTSVLKGTIYAMGGYDGHSRKNSAEKYDHRTNQWSLIAPMNMQRSDASACNLDGKIYITGGFNGQECMHSAEVYDPELNQWSLISPMRSRRSGVSCIAYHGSVYVIGGFNGISRMCSGEKFNPLTNTWTPIPDMYNPRSNFAIEVIDDMIFAIGGFNGVTTIYHVECYDDKTNEWYEATDMNIYRSALSACVIDGLPNVHDYIHKHRDKLMEEKRQKMIALENHRNLVNDQNNNNNHDTIAAAVNANMQQLNILQQLNGHLNPALPPAHVPDPLPMQVEPDENEEH
ncbi:kelch-like protein 10 isoform X3 [Diabrotica virgifera virgifera]|uniref:BTB domain-containing protein n=2 Tax=Diabrotica virgifera virgifera TaxID=50390 RepID=A0ABM5IQ80_DIAVI|nr:kelch-like protein 10 isoform X3 [Diabrotica virgifera virgifera]